MDQAARQLDHDAHRQDGQQLVKLLTLGLDLSRRLLLDRVHADVEREFGMDSMLIPVSETKSIERTTAEIELYQVAVSVAFIGDRGYAVPPGEWCLNWLSQLRLGDLGEHASLRQRLDGYLTQRPEDRRLTFTNVMARVMPESRRAPLVLYRVFPLNVKIATALAFEDAAGATALREAQAELLPGVLECGSCRGEVLASGQSCAECGNPVWKFDWLLAG